MGYKATEDLKRVTRMKSTGMCVSQCAEDTFMLIYLLEVVAGLLLWQVRKISGSGLAALAGGAARQLFAFVWGVVRHGAVGLRSTVAQRRRRRCRDAAGDGGA